ncbi:hypothetical protein C7M84_004395 [Penaeus vannamei]|uniref:Uncharacterized protein n=1 Tax=Penaeus vannamei TaxID=6689 RepID=A0A3R7PMQ2_PENVA|nr:hypothetical protein C7M84_004395 [Penaeus vannamei]
MNASVISDLQTAIVNTDPAGVRRLLDHHGHAIKDRPSCDKDGWSPLHVLAKSGDDFMNCECMKENVVDADGSKGRLISSPSCDVRAPLQSEHTLATYNSVIYNTRQNALQTTDNGRAPTHPPWSWAWACDPSLERHHRARMAIVYMLCDAGVDVNGRDASGLTPLHYAARRGDAAVCDVLLQCGADLYAAHDGLALWDEVELMAQAEVKEKRLNQINHNGQPAEARAPPPTPARTTTSRRATPTSTTPTSPLPSTTPSTTPRAAVPTRWRTTRDALRWVRQLINSWCRVDLTRGGLSLRELAVGTGNEAIISLLLSIHPSMCLVHHALAGDMEAVRELLDSPARKKINIDIRKLSERGAPLLFFLIRGGQHRLIHLLRSHGASLYTHILDDSMVDVPVVFTALEPWMDPEVIKSLLPDATSREARLLERVWNRGKNVLRVAVENGVHKDAIEAILKVGGPALLCERDPEGLTVVDVALQNGRQDLVALMDTFVALWLTRPDLYPKRRDLLALRGFDRLEVVADAHESLAQDVGLFLQEYRRCQGVLQQMFRAVEDGETAKVQQLLYFESDIFHLVDLLWQGRLAGDGMPLLHWAVLHGREQIVNLILRAPMDHPAAHDNHVTPRFCPDDVRDQWRRTPLHYASGLLDDTAIKASLLDLGSSEHSLDMEGREPLDFRDARGSPALGSLLENIKNKIHTPPDLDPWDPDVLSNGHRAPYSPSRPAPYAHGHDMGGPGWPYPAHFPTSPGSNFHWPLPRQAGQLPREHRGGQRLCCIM